MPAMKHVLHERVNTLMGILLALGGQMEIDHCGLQLRMPQIILNSSDIDSCLQEVGCIGMTQGMNGHVSFYDLGSIFGFF